MCAVIMYANMTDESPQAHELRTYTIRELEGLVSNHPRCNNASWIAHDLEVGIFNRTLDMASTLRVTRDWSDTNFQSLYRSIYRSIISNIDKESYVENPDLLDRVVEGAKVDGELKPHDLPFMKADSLFPERWRKIIELTQQRDQYIINARPIAMTDQFKCSRCKGRECSYMELQTRSCDEPASIFVTCHGCGNKWRIG